MSIVTLVWNRDAQLPTLLESGLEL